METAKYTHHRWSVRRPVALDATLYDGRDVPVQVEIQNVSIGGVFIDTIPLIPNSEFPVLLGFLTNDGKEVNYHKLSARVVHTGDTGAGLMFEDYDGDTVAALRQVIHQAIM
ncbi:MAG: PilZ domain-containing protein [Gammaproteobacteria bacterium]|nr:PilZ domain-containing protein [Gammaproteobacteria bacterium]